MTLRDAFVRAALFTYPREFRAQFGDEIIADTQSSGGTSLGQFFDLVKGAVSMRLDAFARDAAYALRRLRSAPLFVAIVVVTFALGIGANVAVFSVLDAVVLRPLPFADAPSLVALTSVNPRGEVFPAISVLDARDIAAHSHALEAVAASEYLQPTLLVNGKPFALSGLSVTPNYLGLLGVKPQLGRGFMPSDARPGVHNAIISNAVWREHFDSDPAIIGRTIVLNRIPYRVVGVLQPNQLLPDANGERIAGEDVLEALPANPPAFAGHVRMAGGIARLAPGVSLSRANADLKLLSADLARTYPSRDKGFSFFAQPLAALVLGGAASSLWIVFAAVVGILLIACANVGNILAARWSSRDRELAVRRALGASSRQIAGQLFIETGLLASIGAACGIAIAYGALHWITGAAGDWLPRAQSIAIDGWSLVYALCIAVAATFLAGLSPIVSLRTGDLQSTLKAAGRGGDGSRRHHLRASLVVAEVAVAIALVIVSGLMLRSFLAEINAPLGIDADGVVVTGPMAFPQFVNGPPAPIPASVEDDLLRRLQALPGVRSASLALFYPIAGMELEAPAVVAGRKYAPARTQAALSNAVSPQYFACFGVKPILGRTFTAADRAGSAPVAVVTESFVAKFLKGSDPLKARIRIYTGPDSWHLAQIVGVVPNERTSVTPNRFIASMPPEYFLPLAQSPPPFFSAIVRAPGLDPRTVGREIDAAFSAVMPLQQPPKTLTIAERIAHDTVQARLMTIFLGALAVMALALALCGIYGVVSFSVTQRSREFGVRIALGATAAAIAGEVLRRTGGTTAIGVAIGLMIASAGARAIAPLLGSVSPFDPATFAAVIALVFLSSTLAALAPALRATRVEPAESLRYE